MKTIAIMQPTYIPWSGYFNLISRSDTFVFLDDVSFEKQSWQTRNKILSNGSQQLLSIPVRKSKLGTPIKDIIINDSINWRKKHISSLNQAYAKSGYKSEVLPTIEEALLDTNIKNLSNINKAIIKSICKLLSIETEIICSSSFSFKGKRSEYLKEICKHLDCGQYLSPEGAREYLTNDNFEEDSGIKVTYQNFETPYYHQINSDSFTSHLSIVDVICNIGIERTKEYIKG